MSSRVIAAKRRKGLLRAGGYKCAYCGFKSLLTIDHITPLSKGGTNTASNLQILCKDCNNKKGNKIDHNALGLKPKPPIRKSLKEHTDKELLNLYNRLYKASLLYTISKNKEKRIANIKEELIKRGLISNESIKH